MNFNLPDETMMIQDTVRRFVDNELIPLEQKFPDRPNSADLPDDVHTKLVGKVEQLGLAAMDAPAEIGGAGLGLSIVQRLVDAHGGCIDLSDTPGGGATFALQFSRGAEEVSRPRSAAE